MGQRKQKKNKQLQIKTDKNDMIVFPSTVCI